MVGEEMCWHLEAGNFNGELALRSDTHVGLGCGEREGAGPRVVGERGWDGRSS